VAVRVVIGITGATGAIFGVRLLEALQAAEVETHLVISAWGRRTIEHETGRRADEVAALATHAHSFRNQASLLSSGSFLTDGMVIAPCSMRTLAAIAHGLTDTLVARAADVTLKERRRLVLLVRETPLNEIHLTNMLALARLGADIVPPVPAFYNRPESIDDLVDHTVGRVLDLLGVDHDLVRRWNGQLT
jgi:4-hydroxy-3-polyprenylbenzoate decarboxylase